MCRHGTKQQFWYSLCKGIVVSVCGEKLCSGHQSRGVWWGLRLALRELEGPLASHLRGLGVVGLGGE